MPQHKSAAKRVRQSEQRRQRNRFHKSRMRTMIKSLQEMEDPAGAKTYYNEVKSFLDRLATKKIISPSRAAHLKSRLEQMVNAS
jgi:small subunit ribosomal protein S20